MTYPTRLEASVVHSICNQLENLGWVVDEKDPSNNVTQQRTKSDAEKRKIIEANGTLTFPDFVLYEKGTKRPIAVIEAKRPGASLEKALNQAEDRYAKPPLFSQDLRYREIASLGVSILMPM